MPYLIDGNNLCGAGRDRRLGLPTKEFEMVRLLARFAARRGACLTVVFDGPKAGRAGSVERVKVLFSGVGETADDVLVKIVRDSARPKDLIVVSSDRELGRRVRSLDGRVMGCRRFAEIIRQAVGQAADGAGEEKPPPADIAEWERYFAGDD